MASNPGEITLLLRDWQNGDSRAECRLFELLMPDLRRIADRCFAKERAGHTLQPTALINEAFLKLSAARKVDWRDRGHFLAFAARVMRRYLIDYWRSKPPCGREALDGLPELAVRNYSEPLEAILALDTALEQMDSQSKQWRAVVELKFYLGLSDEEAAEALDLPLRSLQREWYRARIWLYERLTKGPCEAMAKKTTA
ncbi:MAG: sigma-70 family RNA polymerase sigma factor [Acidobacteriaceae bacterium]|nr:sigma-70 family RNA polymerase sigma factor [Acidobacteriaceae bacterium]